MIFNRVIAGAGGSGTGFVELPIQTTVVPAFTFEQPVLSSNGTIGGNSFAVKADSEWTSSAQAWNAFNNNFNDGWHSGYTHPHWIEFYNPVAIPVSKISVYNHTGYPIKDWEVQYSPDEGTTWITVASGTRPELYNVWNDLDCSNNTVSSKYWRLKSLSSYNNTNFLYITELKIYTHPSNTVSVLDGYLFDSLANLKTGQTVGLKNDIYVVEDSQGDQSLKISQVDVLPEGTTKTALKSNVPVYLNNSKDSIIASKDGLEVTIDTVVEHDGVAVTTVGSPALAGTIASGFDNSNYFYFKKPFNPGSSNWEMHSKVTMPASGGGCIFGATSDQYGVRLKLDTGSGGQLLIGKESGGWITTSGISVSSLSANTTYYIKVGFNNGNYYAKSSTDNTNWTTICTYNNSSTTGTGTRYECIGFNGNNEGGNFQGSIDLSEVYVTVDGVLWDRAWATATPGTATVSTGYTYADETVGYITVESDITKNASQMVVHPEDFEDYSYTVTDYTEQGTPTIVDGKITTPLTGYVEKSLVIPSGTNITAIFKAQYINNGSENIVMSRYGDKHFIAITNNKMRCWTGSSVTSSYTMTDNTVYWFKMTQVGNVYTIYVKVFEEGETLEDADSFEWEQALTTNYTMFSSDTYVLDRNGSYRSQTNWTGFIDLKNSAIYAGDEVIWRPYEVITDKLGYLKLIKPTASTVSMALTGLQNPTAAYAGSVCDPADLGKKILLDTTLTKIKGSEDI